MDKMSIDCACANKQDQRTVEVLQNQYQTIDRFGSEGNVSIEMRGVVVEYNKAVKCGREEAKWERNWPGLG
jgi:hypothetical protein